METATQAIVTGENLTEGTFKFRPTNGGLRRLVNDLGMSITDLVCIPIAEMYFEVFFDPFGDGGYLELKPLNEDEKASCLKLEVDPEKSMAVHHAGSAPLWITS